MALKILAVFCASVLLACSAVNPGFRIAITEKGLSYGISVAVACPVSGIKMVTASWDQDLPVRFNAVFPLLLKP